MAEHVLNKEDTKDTAHDLAISVPDVGLGDHVHSYGVRGSEGVEFGLAILAIFNDVLIKAFQRSRYVSVSTNQRLVTTTRMG